MKFGQLIEYNMRNISPEKPCPKCKLSIFLDQQFEFSYSLFMPYVQAKDYQSILKLGYSHVIFYLQTKFNCLVAFTFLRYQTICLLYFFYPFCDVMNFEIYLTKFSRFPKWPKKYGQSFSTCPRPPFLPRLIFFKKLSNPFYFVREIPKPFAGRSTC